MLGQYLISIQHPDKQADWFILHTDKGSYDLKLGGIKKTNSISKGQLIKLPFEKAKITRTLTNDFSVYIELDNDYCIVHSDTFIYGNGEISFEVYIYNNESYINDGGLEGMFAIKSYD
jgi:hypothetical protein